MDLCILLMQVFWPLTLKSLSVDRLVKRNFMDIDITFIVEKGIIISFPADLHCMFLFLILRKMILVSYKVVH